jgi:hypothetical protein
MNIADYHEVRIRNKYCASICIGSRLRYSYIRSESLVGTVVDFTGATCLLPLEIWVKPDSQSDCAPEHLVYAGDIVEILQ